MSKRLASFNGPSTPTPSPTTTKQPTPTKKKKQPPTPTPTPRKLKVQVQEESEIQQRVRRALKCTSLELQEWERSGLRDAKCMVDLATELEYESCFWLAGVQPRFRVVTEKLRDMNVYKEDMRARIGTMVTDIARFSKRANKIEQALTEFARTNGIQAAEQTPLWTGKTWSLGQHGKSNLGLKHTHSPPDIQDLSEHIIAYGLSGGLHSHDVRLAERDPPAPGQGATVPTFEETRGALVRWAAEAKAIEEWIIEWNEMCALEVVGWDRMPELEMCSSEEDDW
ncbi:unnamed protein product [Rhizoctonia solani]|uniref:Uncharacterized protein n=1 Tax=Rhizoctonia solani TaxID=456999 RepID=A0A8H3GU63_9AGAM|nr:unnamed protein product [Rhizoctonia solani]